MSVELSPSARQQHQEHIERRLRIARSAVQDRPINLKRQNCSPLPLKSLINLPVENPVWGLVQKNQWASHEPWGSMPALLPVRTNRIEKLPPNMIERIKEKVAITFDVSINDLICARRTVEVVRPRQIAMWICKEITPKSLPEIGRRFGGRDHTTVLHAVRKMDRLLPSNPELKKQVDNLLEEFKIDIELWRSNGLPSKSEL